MFRKVDVRDHHCCGSMSKENYPKDTQDIHDRNEFFRARSPTAEVKETELSLSPKRILHLCTYRKTTALVVAW